MFPCAREALSLSLSLSLSNTHTHTDTHTHTHLLWHSKDDCDELLTGPNDDRLGQPYIMTQKLHSRVGYPSAGGPLISRKDGTFG